MTTPASRHKTTDTANGRAIGLPMTRHAAGLPVLVDAEAVATALGITSRHVRRLVTERRIPFVRVGHFIRFDPFELAGWVDQHRVAVFQPVRSRHTERP